MAFLSIEFTNGSNPYLFYGRGDTEAEKQDSIKREPKRWKRNYYLQTLKEADGNLFILADEKRKVERWKYNF